MNKIITLTSLLFAALSLAYAIKQKRTLDRKVRDAEIKTMLGYRRISTQNVFMHPTEEVLKKFTRKSCLSIANQIDNNSYSDDEFGNLSRECAVVILESLAENIPENKSLADYFDENNKLY
ncbi:MAG: hypothetical protein K2K57_11050 [Oscillospiraceae bacterium]|nr:hypothetical protein [Oscillospiraceae bacterium]